MVGIYESAGVASNSPPDKPVKDRLGRFVLDVVRNESLAKFPECLVFYRNPDLAHQIKIEMQIMRCDQPKPQNLPSFDQMPYVAARKSSAC